MFNQTLPNKLRITHPATLSSLEKLLTDPAHHSDQHEQVVSRPIDISPCHTDAIVLIRKYQIMKGQVDEVVY